MKLLLALVFAALFSWSGSAARAADPFADGVPLVAAEKLSPEWLYLMSGHAAGRIAVVGAWQEAKAGNVVYFETRRGAEIPDSERGPSYEVAICVYTSSGVILASQDTSSTLIPYCNPENSDYQASQAQFETLPGITEHTTGYTIASQAFQTLPHSGYPSAYSPEMDALTHLVKGFKKLSRGGVPPGIKPRQYREDMHNGGTPGIGIPPPGAPRMPRPRSARAPATPRRSTLTSSGSRRASITTARCGRSGTATRSRSQTHRTARITPRSSPTAATATTSGFRGARRR